MKPLAENYAIGEHDVICGRGRRCYDHIGNQRFRKMVAHCLDEYSAAATKLEKTFIICEIVVRVRQNSPNGGFVKSDPMTGRFCEVGDFLAREKTSQAFRDALQDQYKSSNTAKKKRRLVSDQSKLRKQKSEPSLGSAANFPSPYRSNDDTNFVANTATRHHDRELGPPIARSSDLEEPAKSFLDFIPFESKPSETPEGWQSCPDLASSNSSSLSADTVASQQFNDWNTPIQIMYKVDSPHMACGKPNELLNRLLLKNAQGFQRSTAPPLAETLTETTQSASMNQEMDTINPNHDEPQGGKSNMDMDLFDSLLMITEGCAITGDPFDPVPLSCT